MGFYEFNLTSDTYSLIRDFSSDFPQGTRIYFDEEGDSSADSRYWAFKGHGAYDSQIGRRPLHYVFVYDKDYDLYNTLKPEGPSIFLMKPHFSKNFNIAFMKSGRSSGVREVNKLLSITTGLSMNFTPALIMSSLMAK